MRSAKIIRGVAILAAAAAAFLSGPGQAQEPKRGGTLNVAMEADWPTMDPTGMGALAERHVAMSIYDTLLELDEEGRLTPNLAESWSSSPDMKTFRLKLRPGVTFHDGTPLDAEAVAYNFRRLMDPANKCRCASDIEPLAEVAVAGPLEVEFRMKSPSAHFPAVLSDVPGMMISPTAAERLGKDYGSQPVGTGSFVFKEWRKGNYFLAVRNPDYWKPGQPHLDEVYYRPMPDDQTRMAALRAGNIDVSLVPAAKDVAEIMKDKSLKVVDPGSLGTNFVMFQAQTGPTADPRLRAAIAHATNREALNKAINRGVYKLARTPFGTGLAPHEKVEGFREYDLDKAKALVKEIGQPPVLRLSIQAVPSSLQIAQALQQMWKKAGIETEIQQYEQVQHIRKAITHDFEVQLFRWPGRADPDLNVYQFFHSRSPRNYTQYANPEMDRLLEAGRAAAEPEERARIYAQVSSLLAKEVPYFFLYYYTAYMLTGNDVNGVPKAPDGLLRPAAVWKSK